MIPRFYDATSGEVFLLGRPVKEWDKETLRQKVGIVMQKVQVFSGTIRSNLLMGNEEATEKEMWQALRDAQAEEFVRKKSEGLDEPVEQGGRIFPEAETEADYCKSPGKKTGDSDPGRQFQCIGLCYRCGSSESS